MFRKIGELTILVPPPSVNEAAGQYPLGASPLAPRFTCSVALLVDGAEVLVRCLGCDPADDLVERVKSVGVPATVSPDHLVVKVPCTSRERAFSASSEDLKAFLLRLNPADSDLF